MWDSKPCLMSNMYASFVRACSLNVSLEFQFEFQTAFTMLACSYNLSLQFHFWKQWEYVLWQLLNKILTWNSRHSISTTVPIFPRCTRITLGSCKQINRYTNVSGPWYTHKDVYRYWLDISYLATYRLYAARHAGYIYHYLCLSGYQ